MIDDPMAVTEAQAEEWVTGFDNWEICDQVCMNLFDKVPAAWQKAVAWSSRPEEFVKRAAFALVARLAWVDKQASDTLFQGLLPIIAREASDERRYVQRSVDWALRQIGKRNRMLNVEAVAAARELRASGSRGARWVGSQALRELTSEAVQKRLGR